jgi:hypothetical protein
MWKEAWDTILAPSTHWIGGWVGLRVSLDIKQKRIFLTLLGFKLNPTVNQPIDSQLLFYSYDLQWNLRLIFPHVNMLF